MKKVSISSKINQPTLPKATKGATDAQHVKPIPQTLSPTYRLAFTDTDLLLTDEMRGVRLELEWTKPELHLKAHGIHSTIVVFGGARVLDAESAKSKHDLAQKALEQSPNDPALKHNLVVAERMIEKARYYEEAKELGRIVSSTCQAAGLCDFVVVTGGGPGIMEAANRGAHEACAKSIGLNIVLPHEQAPNPYITPQLCFNFHYFAIRKMHFLMRAKALVCFPGGFGTLDELFEALTLIQTKKIDPLPVILIGKKFWTQLVNFDFLVQEGTISPEDLNLFQYAETAVEAWYIISKFYTIKVESSS